MKRSPEEDIDLIERYFDNALSAEEAGDLQVRLKSDVAFQKLFEREKILVGAIRIDAATKDLEYLKNLERSLPEIEQISPGRPWYYLAAAATVALIALAWWQSGNEDPQALYAEYFLPHPNIFAPTLRGETNSTERARAFQAYEQGDYDRASVLFEELLTSDRDPGVLMLLGNSNLILGKVDASKNNFSELIDGFDDLDTAAKWYLSLCYLREGETEAAAKILKEIQGASSPYAAKARDLLGELNR